MLSFRETEIAGVFVVDADPAVDERGAFSRSYCRREFAAQGIDFVPAQVSSSTSRRRGTLRGLHFQAEPHAESKLVTCLRGAAFDVAVDLRQGSATYGRWTSVDLSGESRRAAYIPAGCAHGFQTLEDDTELLYLISELYEPELQRGVRWDDPALGIDWPAAAERILSGRDAALPALAEVT